MIKRPGNEDYLGKVMEEERQAYLKVLEVAPVQSMGAGQVGRMDDESRDDNHYDDYDDEDDEDDGGLTITVKPHED